jgi:hypothetical protein
MIHLIFEDIIVRWVISFDNINNERAFLDSRSRFLIASWSTIIEFFINASHKRIKITEIDKSFMFNSHLRNSTLLESFFLSKAIIQAAKHLKTLFEANLHKKRIKSLHRDLYEVICHLYSETSLSTISKQSKKDKTRAAKALKNLCESFSFEWIMNLFLIINAVKSLIKQIENFKRNLVFKAFQYKDRNISFIDNTFKETTSKTNSMSIHSVKENISNLDLSSITFEQKKELMLQKIEFFDLSTSSRISRSNKFAEFLNSRISCSSQVESSSNSENTESNESKQTRRHNFSQTRVHSKVQSTRVHTEKNLFQSSHLTNLRKLFAAQFFVLSTFISLSNEKQISKTSFSQKSKRALIELIIETTFFEEYSSNVSSIVFRQYRIQSFQELIQRNFDFLESIFLKSIKSDLERITKITVDSSSTHVNQDSLISAKSTLFESNQKESFQADFNIRSKRKKISFQFFFTTFVSLKQINSFVSSSTLFFDSLFQQFRLFFSSDFFISSTRSVFSSKLSAELNSNLDSSRIQKLNESLHSNKSSSNQAHKLNFTDFTSFTIITSAMSIFEENVSFHSVSNLTQQNIQDIVLFMFNLFAQNVQNQTQVKAIETINEAIISIVKKSSFRASNVRFFDSQLNFFYDSDDVVQVKRDLYYRDVYFFVERIKDVVIMFDVEVVRTNLSTCLRESTQMWYTEDLSDLKKKTLRTLNESADHWCNVLLKKFKKFVASTLNYLTIERYILDDVRVNRNISSFVFQMMRHAKIVNIVDLHDQLIWIYNAIVSKLIKDINSFDENITIMIFLKNLETKKNIWHRIYNRKSIISRTKFKFFYQINFIHSTNFFYDQFNQIYTSRQYLQRQFQSLESDSESRDYQKFQTSDNVYQKNKIFLKNQKNIDEYNQQIRSSNATFDQIQFSSFETQQVRNQTISAWRQNAS